VSRRHGRDRPNLATTREASSRAATWPRPATSSKRWPRRNKAAVAVDTFLKA
jgi:hypothetical protein